jgi:hypothetical protein
MAEVSEAVYRTQARHRLEDRLKMAHDDGSYVADETKEFAKWCGPLYGSLCDRGVDGLIVAGKAKVEKKSDDDFDDGIWWVKPEAIEIKDIAGDKYTINKGAAERILIHLGLHRSIDYLIGSVRVVAKTDAGDTVKSEPVKITVCTP